jgi:hypothetical protein
MQKIKLDTSKIRKWLPLIICVLSLSYCTFWVLGYSHLKKLEDDEYVGKTLLIYPTAGQFSLKEHWYFGKQFGDSSFYRSPPDLEGENPPVLYRMVGKYKEVNHGGKLLAGVGLNKYLIEPVVGKTDRRLFFFSLPRCDEKSDLTDPDTGIKIDFVCD